MTEATLHPLYTALAVSLNRTEVWNVGKGTVIKLHSTNVTKEGKCVKERVVVACSKPVLGVFNAD